MKLRYALLALGLMISNSQTINAIDLDNATWTASGSVTTSGSGTLNGINIAITTVAVSNGGTTNGQDWDAISFISNAGLTNITPAGSIDLAFNGNATSQQVVTFSGSGLTNPYIFINFTESGDTFDFGSNTATLIAGSNAQQVGNTFTSTGATNTQNDGFVVKFNGTFTNLSFDVIRVGALDSVSFSVAVPEPSTYLLGAASAISLFVVQIKRKRSVHQS
jgi:hypothetical protein